MRTILTFTCVAILAGCGSTTMQSRALIVAVRDAQTGLASYQAALGVAQVALASNPALLAKINALSTQAAPYVSLVQTGVDNTTSASSLSALAAEMLVVAAPYIMAVPNVVKG